MNTVKTLLLLAVVFVTSNMSAQSISEKWPAIKSFHGVMSQTFHPSEEGNLEPIKKRSQEMVDKAEALVKSDIPAEYKTKAILASAERLQINSKALHKMVVAKASDADITKKLAELHDTFHEIMGLCSSEKH
jgi:hypothetical protein